MRWILILLLTGCTDGDTAAEFLRMCGYREAQIRWWPGWCNGDPGYWYWTRFEAKYKGKDVAGTVCCGGWKGCRVRVDP